jgi:hypothetical protein
MLLMHMIYECAATLPPDCGALSSAVQAVMYCYRLRAPPGEPSGGASIV